MRSPARESYNLPPAPPIDSDVSGFELDRDVKRELSSLRAEAAEQTAKHLVMVARLIDSDPESAHTHAIAARRLAPRLGLVREAVGLAAYHAGLFADALSELRAARRISGGDEHWPVLADCERALGRPERALAMAAAPEVEALDRAGRVEMRIVAAGARADLGQLDAAVVTLQCPELHEDSPKPWAARLRYAYAEALVEAGRAEEGRAWFARAADVDPDGLTPAEERCQELDGITFEFAEDDEEDEAGESERAPAAGRTSIADLADLADPRDPAGDLGSEAFVSEDLAAAPIAAQAELVDVPPVHIEVADEPASADVGDDSSPAGPVASEVVAFEPVAKEPPADEPTANERLDSPEIPATEPATPAAKTPPAPVHQALTLFSNLE